VEGENILIEEIVLVNLQNGTCENICKRLTYFYDERAVEGSNKRFKHKEALFL